MELKPYQKDVIYDLSRFLALLVEKKSAGKAYNALWEEKNVIVGMNGMPYYQSILKNNVPDVTFKVPTGGGKTFLAASSIKPIFDAMPEQRAKAVVWLVPSDSLLVQTQKNLMDIDAERKRISLSIRQVLEEEAEEVSTDDLAFDEDQPVASVDTEAPAEETAPEA